MSKRIMILISAATVSLTGCGAAVASPSTEPASAVAEQRRAPLPHPALTSVDSKGHSGSVADAIEKALPSVVSIWSKRTAKPDQMRGLPFDDPFFRRFFGPQMPDIPREQQGMGSGVVVSKGYILTNNHVIEGADEIRVTTPDKREYKVEVVGSDPKSDLAVLKVGGNSEGLVPIPLGDSSELRLGDVVIAIGNPFGVGQTVTMGIVSAKGRANVGIVDYEDFIQTDAAINPGNSGGALINMRGELVGINTAIMSRTGGNMGIGFAIPTNMARPIMQSLIEHGKVVRGWLGVVIQEVDAEMAQALNLASSAGVLVSDVQANSPAQKAGLSRGDVILEVDGRAVNSTGELRNLVAAAGANVATKLTILRAGKRQQLTVRLGELPAELAGAKEQPTAPGSGQGKVDGFVAEDLNALNRKRFEIPVETKSGVVITEVEPGTAVVRAGVRPGDVILEVNRRKVASVAELKEHWRKAKGRTLLLLMRDGVTHFLVVKR